MMSSEVCVHQHPGLCREPSSNVVVSRVVTRPHEASDARSLDPKSPIVPLHVRATCGGGSVQIDYCRLDRTLSVKFPQGLLHVGQLLRIQSRPFRYRTSTLQLSTLSSSLQCQRYTRPSRSICDHVHQSVQLPLVATMLAHLEREARDKPLRVLLDLQDIRGRGACVVLSSCDDAVRHDDLVAREVVRELNLRDVQSMVDELDAWGCSR